MHQNMPLQTPADDAALKLSKVLLFSFCRTSLGTYWYYSKAHVMQRPDSRLVHVICQLSEDAVHILEGQG